MLFPALFLCYSLRYSYAIPCAIPTLFPVLFFMEASCAAWAIYFLYGSVLTCASYLFFTRKRLVLRELFIFYMEASWPAWAIYFLYGSVLCCVSYLFFIWKRLVLCELFIFFMEASWPAWAIYFLQGCVLSCASYLFFTRKRLELRELFIFYMEASWAARAIYFLYGSVLTCVSYLFFLFYFKNVLLTVFNKKQRFKIFLYIIFSFFKSFINCIPFSLFYQYSYIFILSWKVLSVLLSKFIFLSFIAFWFYFYLTTFKTLPVRFWVHPK